MLMRDLNLALLEGPQHLSDLRSYCPFLSIHPSFLLLVSSTPFALALSLSLSRSSLFPLITPLSSLSFSFSHHNIPTDVDFSTPSTSQHNVPIVVDYPILVTAAQYSPLIAIDCSTPSTAQQYHIPINVDHTTATAAVQHVVPISVDSSIPIAGQPPEDGVALPPP